MTAKHLALAVVVLTLATSAVSALTPFPKPEPTDDVANANAHAFAGSWAIRNPTMTMGEPDRSLAICSLPIRIEAMGGKTMIYYQPGETRSGTILTLRAIEGGTLWTPDDGSDSDFAFWVSRDAFYFYDDVPTQDAEWGHPYIFTRCD